MKQFGLKWGVQVNTLWTFNCTRDSPQIPVLKFQQVLSFFLSIFTGFAQTWALHQGVRI